MKRHGNLFDKICHPDNILYAFKAASKGRRTRKEVVAFEQNLSTGLLEVQRLLYTQEFSTAEYRVKTIFEPKQRDIYILPFFPDRIVHHAVLQVLIPIWDNLMIYHSFACRTGKGMHEASTICKRYVEAYDYCFKCDISKFYPSINHKVLLGIISQKIKCRLTLQLLSNIVDSFEGETNVPIGNYTSQWFGNLYMNELDQYVKHTCKAMAYIRYCDDVVIFSNSKHELADLKNKIQMFIAENLLLKFSKWSIFPTSQGVDFLGYRHFESKILLRKSTVRRVRNRLQRLPSLLKEGHISFDGFRSSVFSTLGWVRWADTYNFQISVKLLEYINELKSNKNKV